MLASPAAHRRKSTVEWFNGASQTSRYTGNRHGIYLNRK